MKKKTKRRSVLFRDWKGKPRITAPLRVRKPDFKSIGPLKEFTFTFTYIFHNFQQEGRLLRITKGEEKSWFFFAIQGCIFGMLRCACDADQYSGWLIYYTALLLVLRYWYGLTGFELSVIRSVSSFSFHLIQGQRWSVVSGGKCL